MKNAFAALLYFIFAASILLSSPACKTITKDNQMPLLFISSYSDSADQGLVLYSLDPDSLSGKVVQALGEQPNPSYFDFHPSGRYFYMVSSEPARKGDAGGSLNAYRIDPVEGKMEFINAVPSYGVGPCHVCLDRTGSTVFISSYGSGSLSVYPVLEDGRIGDSLQFFQYEGSSVNPNRQNGPHTHSSLISHDNGILYVADLGTDKVMVYEFDAETGLLNPAAHPWISSPAGAGPRHMELHPGLDILYVAEELSSSISVYNTSGIRTEGASVIQRLSTLPPEFNESNTVADIHISPDGKHVYVSNRGHNSIAVFKTDPEDGSLSPAGHQSTFGNWPRSFSLSANANLILVANQRSDNISLFRRNAETGLLEETGTEVLFAAPKCIKFLFF